MRKYYLFTLFFLIGGQGACYAATPVLLFSDLVNAPRAGWEGSGSRGAAVTVWGLNFGAQRGASTLSCGGQTLSTDSDFAEWGVAGHAAGIPRGLQRITFWLNSAMAVGDQKIMIKVNGLSSNALDIYIRANGDIWFCHPQNGNDDNNGRTVASAWKSPKYIMPSYGKPGVGPGDILYIKQGARIYTRSDVSLSIDDYFVEGEDSGDAGTPNNHIAIVGYPGEFPEFSGENYFFGADNAYYTQNAADRIVISKLKFTGGRTALTMWGIESRTIGCEFNAMTADAMDGIIWLTTGLNNLVAGCYFHDNDGSKYKHSIYCKSAYPEKPGMQNGASGHRIMWNEFVSEGYDYGGLIEIQSVTGEDPANNIRIAYNLFNGDNDTAEIIRFGPSVRDVDVAFNVIVNQTNQVPIFIGMVYDNTAHPIRLINNTFFNSGLNSSASCLEDGNSIIQQLWTPGSTLQSFNNLYVQRVDPAGCILYQSPGGNRADFYNDGYTQQEPAGEGVVRNHGLIRLGASPLTNPGKGDFSLHVGGDGVDAVDAGTTQPLADYLYDYMGRPIKGEIPELGAVWEIADPGNEEEPENGDSGGGGGGGCFLKTVGF